MHGTRHARRRVIATLCTGLAAAAMLVAASGSTAHGAPPPPNPSDSQLQDAQAKKNALASKVGQLSGEIATLQGRINALDAAAELAEQKLAYALDQLARAKVAATEAQARVAAAQAAVEKANEQFSAFVRASYISGPISGAAGSLLTAPDPTALLQRSDFLRYSADHRVDAIGALNRATIARSNAEAAARGAVQRQASLTQAAADAKQAADDALTTAQEQKQRLNSVLSANQSALDSARLQLATLNDQRAKYLAWQREQARILAARRAAEARARAQALAAARARAAADAARAAAQAQESGQQDSGGGGAGGGGGGVVTMSAPRGGAWSAAAGQEAVNRAMGYLGIRYAFAAGNFGGPTYGVCVSGDAWNDCRVFGFDCSGLSLYAWAPYLHLDHYAATQYWQAGSYHPDTGALLPGDLVFWSSNGAQSGIHHVAIYIGGGNVVQAPQSGDIVRVTPLGEVSSDYFGATRPLT